MAKTRAEALAAVAARYPDTTPAPRSAPVPSPAQLTMFPTHQPSTLQPANVQPSNLQPPTGAPHAITH